MPLHFDHNHAGQTEFGAPLVGSTFTLALVTGQSVTDVSQNVYCGRYEFRGETVIHHVELSLFPNWVGVEQERLVELRGDLMTLSTRPMLFGGMQRSAHLIWERV